MNRLYAPFVALWLALIPLGAACAGIFPFVIGEKHQTAGSSSLSFLTNRDCPASGMVLVAESEFGSDAHPTTVTDSATLISGGNTYVNTYLNVGSDFFHDFGGGTVMRGAMFTNNTNTYTAIAVPKNTTITVNYPSSSVDQAAIAVCVIGTREGPLWGNDPMNPFYGKPIGPEGNAGMPWGTGTNSLNPTIQPIALSNPGEIVFVLTLIANGGGDSWLESSGYTMLASRLGANATRLAYAIVNGNNSVMSDGVTPPIYSATNGATKDWIVQYMPYVANTCGLTSSGGGPC